jgi:hypothetical protein
VGINEERGNMMGEGMEGKVMAEKGRG